MFRQIILTVFCIVPLLANAQGSFTITLGTTLKLTGGAVITLDNLHLDNDGTVSLSSGDGTLRFSGNVTTNISGSAQPLFDTIEIAKTGGAQLVLQRNIGVGSQIIFNTGLLNLNNQNILLQPNGLLIGESETSHIIGSNGGYVEIVRTLNAPSSVNPGNLGAIITSSQNPGSTIIRRGHQSQVNASGIGTSILRYYDIIPANNTSLNATLRFQYLDTNLNGFNENSIVLWKSIDNVHWTTQGFSSRNTTANYVEKTGIADFSRWTLSSVNNPLPVNFILFNARCDRDKVALTWKTAQELNSHHFNVERSTNGNHWTVIGTVSAAGNSNSEQSYSFTDNGPIPTNVLYRIAEYDIDGRVIYTSILRPDCNSGNIFQVWPNPVNQALWMNIVAISPSSVGIKLFDSKGALVGVQQNNLLPGSNQLKVNMEQMPAGVYHMLVEWNNGQTRKTIKIVKVSRF